VKIGVQMWSMPSVLSELEDSFQASVGRRGVDAPDYSDHNQNNIQVEGSKVEERQCRKENRQE
jgi:hypothetical protein